MPEHSDDPTHPVGPAGVNPGYAAFQLARAFTTSEHHEDEATRQRARERLARWEAVLRNMLTGAVQYGSRTPLARVPAWATLEVVTGGFATGALLAAGPLQAHELDLLAKLPDTMPGEERRALNAYFLTEEGLTQLQSWLQTGCYEVSIPEEGALLVVAWLLAQGYAEEARGLLETLAPYFPQLRFYPVPRATPRHVGTQVHVQDVSSITLALLRIRPNQRILAQKEAATVWAPLYDRIIALFLETVQADWPCQHYPEGWSARALALLEEYAALRETHSLCSKPERPGGHYAQLRTFLDRCAREPETLTGREVGRIRLILQRYMAKRGAPGSATCTLARQEQEESVRAPTHHAIAGVVALRLEPYPGEEGLDTVDFLMEAVTPEEAGRTDVPEGTRIPPSIRRKAERCLNERVEVLVERGLLTSGETLARLLPQITSTLRAIAIPDPALRSLYAAIYRAFRKRRSLLLLNLEKQVQLEELPWIAAIEPFRSESLASQALARQALEELTLLTLRAFPQTLVPNKLLQEMRALVEGAGLDIPLVDELAADIFMGKFSPKFVAAARQAAGLLTGSLYVTYYGIDYEEVRRLPDGEVGAFAELCASRAGVPLGTWHPATNGMIIEQQQILTTQNLAALVMGLELLPALQHQLGELARRCFRWICRRQQLKIEQWHSRLRMLKNTAYAWRQMVFFLALLPDDELTDFLRWAEESLAQQPDDFQARFRPALEGLVLAAAGYPRSGRV